MKTLNKSLLVVDYKTEDSTIYTNESILACVCEFINQPFQIYHNSDSGSVYAYLLNTRKNDGYVTLRVSDHSVLSRGFIASTGGADKEIILERHNDLFDLEEMAEELLEDIEEYTF